MIKKTLERHRLFRIITWVWLAILTILLLLPSRDIPRIDLNLGIPIDKLVHFTSLFIATGSFLLSIHWEENKHRVKIIIGLISYGIFMEFFQHMLQKSRDFEVADILANLAGVLTAVLLYIIVGKIIKN